MKLPRTRASANDSHYYRASDDLEDRYESYQARRSVRRSDGPVGGRGGGEEPGPYAAGPEHARSRPRDHSKHEIAFNGRFRRGLAAGPTPLGEVPVLDRSVTLFAGPVPRNGPRCKNMFHLPIDRSGREKANGSCTPKELRSILDADKDYVARRRFYSWRATR